MAKYLSCIIRPTEQKATIRVNFEDLGHTPESWEALTHDQKDELLQLHIADNQPDGCYYYVETQTVKDDGKD